MKLASAVFVTIGTLGVSTTAMWPQLSALYPSLLPEAERAPLLFLTGVCLALGALLWAGRHQDAEELTRSHWLRLNGLHANGRLLGVSNPLADTLDDPRAELTLEITLPGKAPYELTLHQAIPRARAGRTHLPVRVHPQRSDEVLIEW